MIQAEHVRFAYRGMEPVLRDLNLTEETGRCLAFLGNNGAGKSTFLKCLNRILEPQEGLVVVDGMEIRNTPPGADRPKACLCGAAHRRQPLDRI